MTLKKSFWLVICFLTVNGLMAELAVRNINVQQRWPWNGLVDIDYEVVCDDPNADVYVSFSGTDKDLNQKIKIMSITGDGANNQPVKAGKHRATWNMSVDAPNLHTTAFSLHIELSQGSGLYMVIDISGGTEATSYPVAYSVVGPDLNDDSCRTTKLWLRFIPPNTSAVTDLNVDYGYYMGVFEVTQKQYELIMGSNPSSTVGEGSTYLSNMIGDDYPVYFVSYSNIRGSGDGAGYPSHNRVDADSFMGVLRAKTGLNADLPTETQWEYACRAGTMNNTTNVEGKELDEIAWYNDNSSSKVHIVGTKIPNAWGCYDMLGNVWEWCRDYYSGNSGNRILRGGSWLRISNSNNAISVTYRFSNSADTLGYYFMSNYRGNLGFRLAILPFGQ